MKDDSPTVPELNPYDAQVRARGDVPTWPAMSAARQRPSGQDLRFIALGASLAVNALLLIALLGFFVATRVGLFAQSSSFIPPTQTGSALKAALSSPTVAASPTSGAGGLQVAPASVHLGCDGGQQTQFAVLANTGSVDVQWQMQLASAGDGDQTPIAVSPRQGNLRAGTSIVLQIQNRSQTGVSQGTVQFVPAASDAGSTAMLSYVALGCGGS